MVTTDDGGAGASATPTTPTSTTPGDERPFTSKDPSSSARLAIWAFVLVQVGAFTLWVSRGRTQWFREDEWEYLVDRSALSPGDLLDDHVSHWTTLPILAYRALYQVFGLRSYLPYLVLAVAVHLMCAALLRAVMRRAGVDPWIATAAASLYALFGAGFEDIVWGVGIAFSGALAFGLGYLLLADHDGPLDRRDWLGLAVGLGALMCNGVGVIMVAAVCLVLLIRRGARIALVHSGSLGSVYLLWWLAIGREGYLDDRGRFDAEIGEVARFAAVGIRAAFGNLGQLPGVGLVLGVLLVAGLALAFARLDRATLRLRAVVPGALALAAVAYGIASGFSRVGLFGPDFARTSRYQAVFAALLLPALALALDTLARLSRPLVTVFCVLLVAGVPGNVDILSDWVRGQEPAHDATRHLVLSIPRTEAARDVPRAVQPITTGFFNRAITVGWLRDAERAGRLPRPSRITRADEREIEFRLSLLQTHAPAARPEGCDPLTTPQTRHLEQGDTITFIGGPLRVSTAPGSGARAVQLYEARDGERITAVRGPLDVVLAPASALLAPRLCDAGAG